MIKGIGTDLVDINRIRKAVKKWNSAFLEKIFTEKELSYCNNKKDPLPSLAGRFAAKEAIMKALGLGFPKISFKDIEIIDNNGAPKVIFSSKAKKIVEEKGISSCLVSISHIDSLSSAFAIIE